MKRTKDPKKGHWTLVVKVERNTSRQAWQWQPAPKKGWK